MLKIQTKRKYDFPKTGIENDTIFKDLPGQYGKARDKHSKRGLRPQRPDSATPVRVINLINPAMIGPNMFWAWVWIRSLDEVNLFTHQRDRHLNIPTSGFLEIVEKPRLAALWAPEEHWWQRCRPPRAGGTRSKLRKKRKEFKHEWQAQDNMGRRPQRIR